MSLEIATDTEMREPVEQGAMKRPLMANLIVLCLLGGLFFAVLNVGHEWKAPYRQSVTIDLSFWKLPQYTLYSLARGCVAMVFSLIFTILYATWAYYDSRVRPVLLSILDILQSIPVLGFMPSLVLAMVALFPKSNMGLELACVLMIFTAQVWNMVFSYYDSLKAIPAELRHLGVLYGFTPWQRFYKIELPFATQGLVYNCMVSMAAGWFFLTINEAFTLGSKNFQLPGLGSYMSVAIANNNRGAEIAAVVAMGAMIIMVDRLLWWPLVIWSRKFKIEDTASGPLETTLVQRMLAQSNVGDFLGAAFAAVGRLWRAIFSRPPKEKTHKEATASHHHQSHGERIVYLILLVAIFALGGYGIFRLGGMIIQVHLDEWGLILGSAGTTFLRVLASLIISSVWTIPVGVWVGLNPKVSRYLQPVIQFAASFPAPMLYPIIFGWILATGGNLGWGSIVLMMLGAQWYILFNVAAGAQSIPADMIACADVFQIKHWSRWRNFILPAIFPYLVTGWITSAGGAWNASIVAEFLVQGGTTYHAYGLGNLITQATNDGKFNLLAAAVVTMAVCVVFINRMVWRRLQHKGDLYCRFGG